MTPAETKGLRVETLQRLRETAEKEPNWGYGVYLTGEEAAAVLAEVLELREALKLAYPYVKDCLSSEARFSARQIVIGDLEVISAALSQKEEKK